MIVEKVSLDGWKKDWIDICYPLCFNSSRPKELEKCNYALLVKEGAELVCFTTAIEMDSETVYWQFGGALEKFKKSFKVMTGYMLMVRWEKETHKRITTRIENTNISMLKMAMAAGFRVHGTWHFDGKIYLELLNEFGGN
jgi:hypothetical protein